MIKRFIPLIVFLYSCDTQETLFYEVEDSGIEFINQLSPSASFNILNYLYYYNGGGVSIADFNNDNLPDIYFTSNQSSDKLYLNNGNLSFSDITFQSNLNNTNGWTTGSTVVDINNDGLLDIYITKVDIENNKGRNLLFINQGNVNGVPFFYEDASTYGLDISSFGTHAIFFDLDNDLDLDMFLVNHSVYPSSNYGNGKIRRSFDEKSGDKIFENIDGKFYDISESTGIYQGKIGYGLAGSVGDLNNDGYSDLYIGNDFFENDYLYINQGNKKFKEMISLDKSYLGHTTHFSMGNSISDINNDGLLDIISLDMLPEDIYTYKSSGVEYPYQTYMQYLNNDYSPQFMQNTLHLNSGNDFHEIAYLSGISATEWSWTPLVVDFNLDGYKDLFITNGILGATNDMDYINFISNEDIQSRLGMDMDKKDLELSNSIPQKKVKNYIFKNNKDLTFSNETESWFDLSETFSNGAAFSDLDNDGDIDIVINNLNSKAQVFENRLKSKKFIKFKFNGPKNNPFGIGTVIKIFSENETLIEHNYTSNGYLSSKEPYIHFGIGNKQIDSLHVIWPDKKFQKIINILPNQSYVIDYKDSETYYDFSNFSYKDFLKNTNIQIDFDHDERSSVEFNRDPIIPYSSNNEGPDLSIGDINNDGLDDLFISGAKGQSSKVFIQQENGEFESEFSEIFDQSKSAEDISSIFVDVNSDSYLDLVVVSGGNEFKEGKNLKPRLYINEKGKLKIDKINFSEIEINASKVIAVDYDNDGDQDISIFSDNKNLEFGSNPSQYIFSNDGNGLFTDVTELVAHDLINYGSVKDAEWIDIDFNGYKDLILAGFWEPIRIFYNNGSYLSDAFNNGLDMSNGLWNTIKIHDFDKDGDLDMIAGNWSLNTRLKASKEYPITLYKNDYDNNGKIDPVIGYYEKGKETVFASKDEIVKQIPLINKKYLSYRKFASANFNDIFSKKKLNQSNKKKIYHLESAYFENDGSNNFEMIPLPILAQISSVNSIFIKDFNEDGLCDLFIVGNNHQISTQLGRLDSSSGQILINNGNFFDIKLNNNFKVAGSARDIKEIIINNKKFLIVSINDDKPQLLEIL